MRKYRPTYKCIYVIPEIKGNAKSLEIILNRILPLRFSLHQEDKLIFLGDYIDQGEQSDKVLDILINLKNECPEQITFIKGNHDEILLRALKSKPTYDYWLSIGGLKTIQGYLERKKINADPFSFPHSRLTDIIPKEHIQFLYDLKNYYITDEYIFLHSGLNLQKKIEDNSIDDLLFTNSFSKNIKLFLKNKQELDLNNTYVISHNYKSKKPFIYKNCLMLNADAPKNIVLFELNSMSCSIMQDGKSRFYKHNFKYFE